MEAEKEKATNDDCSQAASSIEVPEIVAGAVSPVKDESDSPAENSNGKSSQNENTLTWEKAVSMETTESAHESSDSDSGADNDGLSDYEKLRLERIRRNQEYLSRLGLEEQKDKLRPQKRARKKKDESTVPEETSQQRKASLRRKTEQVRYSDVSIREILGRKTRAPESQSRKRKPERDVQHRMERFIYREFQRMQAERNTSQKQIELLIRRIEKETAFWKKLVEQNESREQLSQTRRSELEAERAIFGGLTLRQLLKQIDQRFPELIQAAKDYDQEIKVSKS